MRSIRHSCSALLGVLWVILAACGDGTGPKTPVVTVDTLLAEIDAGLEQVAPAVAMAGVSLPASVMPSEAICPYNATTQRFVCASATVNNFTYNRFYQLLDASGSPQSAFNPATTAAIRFVSDVSGTMSSALPEAPPSTLSITGHDEHTLSGLLTDTRTLNGEGAASGTFTAGEVTGGWTINTATTNLVLPKRGTAEKYPQSGTVSMEFSLSGGGPTTSITLTFNGTPIVTMVMTTDGTTQTCTIDLSKPDSLPSCG